MKYPALFLVLSTVLFAATCRADEHVKLDLKDGDRVAFIGNTFVEREAKDCYIETMLTSRFPDRNITFRNLGYSADTVTGSARGLCAGWSTFEGPDKAFDRLRKLVAEFKPTVLLMNYGMTESFSGSEGIPTFVGNYNKMLDALSTAAGTSPRIVLMSPNFHENLGKPWPDPTEHNKNLRLYSDAIASIAKERKCAYVDLFRFTEDMLNPQSPMRSLTSNGIHLTPYGYWQTSFVIERYMALPSRNWNVTIDATGKLDHAAGTKVSNIKVLQDGIEFSAADDFLPLPPLPEIRSADAPAGGVSSPLRTLCVKGLRPGNYQLKIGELTVIATAEQWAGDIHVPTPPGAEQAEALRKLIVAKNFDFFNYQRPDNDAYILAFRKGEQGRNAGEIPQFLPLVAEKEKQIAELRVPKPVTYTLTVVK